MALWDLRELNAKGAKEGHAKNGRVSFVRCWVGYTLD
jgi:hypothetical protein